jgi:hypothetical protein
MVGVFGSVNLGSGIYGFSDGTKVLMSDANFGKYDILGFFAIYSLSLLLFIFGEFTFGLLTFMVFVFGVFVFAE